MSELYTDKQPNLEPLDEMSMEKTCTCSYCSQPLYNTDYLRCDTCCGYVHVKCLHNASTPGALLGDVFFSLTCAKCNILQVLPSTSTNSESGTREKLVRQRLPWLMVITLSIYNLSIQSKGLSHHGYFHWRSHIVSFINKNWDYLFPPLTKRRKNWIGSVTGTLSHNSPVFFLSGQEVFHEQGWWKLTYSNLTPKFIYKKYEEICQRRTQERQGKRMLDDSNIPCSEAADLAKPTQEAKRMRPTDSNDDDEHVSCSRTLPYMGRKAKLAKQPPTATRDMSKNVEQDQNNSLNTVQSSLMDFLAENLSNDDLTMFNTLSNIAPEPALACNRNDLLNLIDNNNESLSVLNMPEVQIDSVQLNEYEVTSRGKLENYPLVDPSETSAINKSVLSSGKDKNEEQTESDDDDDDDDSDNDEDDDENDAQYNPRIIQVTNFQKVETDGTNLVTTKIAELDNGRLEIKREIQSDTEESENGDSSSKDDQVEGAAVYGKSLFTKSTRRNFPWLTTDTFEDEEEEDNQHDLNANETNVQCQNLTTLSGYEEKELLLKMRKIFSLETKCQLKIPTYMRRFYRKLCIREWSCENSKPLFNLDDLGAHDQHGNNLTNNIIDRYQLISVSVKDTRRSFYARIAGSIEYEKFESPYTQRILHPFIYRNPKCFPPWLKLMCEVQYTASGTIPQRAPIDFCYVRPNHIAAVNALLQSEFWPHIDMSECLSYPDFSVVAMYKKLVIGCGFLVPDVGFNEAYISFMAVRPCWQRSGIATFMLYHLIQTCMTKDITLHVSATNPAVVLYQKFGFKIEEVIHNFYDKYLPIDSKQSRHAFFLRLAR